METSSLAETVTSPSNPGSFSGVAKIRQSNRDEDGKPKFSKGQILKWFQSQDFYTLHKSPKTDFPRAKVVVPHPDYQYDMDSAYMTSYPSKQNDGYKYFVVFIDVFSKLAHAFAVRSLSGEEIVGAMQKLLSVSNTKPDKFRSDLGVEFKNKQVASFLKEQGIDHFFAQSDKKANVAERFIRTIKTKLVRYMKKNKTVKWVDVLPDMVESYNNSFHRTLGKSPAEVKKGDIPELWQRMYDYRNVKPHAKLISKHKHKEGDNVRISLTRHPYAKAYDEYWTRELFTITSLKFNQYIPVYEVKDWHNDPIGGKFYEAELNKVDVADDAEYDVEKVIKRRTLRGEKQYFVKWKGWPNSFNSWISAGQMQEYK